MRKYRSAAHRASAPSCASGRCVAHSSAKSTGTGRAAPSGDTSRSCSTRNRRDCKASGMSPISSRNSTPHAPAAAARRPWRRAPVSPVFIAEEFGFDQAFRQRRAVHRHERPGGAPLRACIWRANTSLPAGFALQQNGDAGIHQVHRSTQRVQRRRVQADGGWRGRDGAELTAFRRRHDARRGRRRQSSAARDRRRRCAPAPGPWHRARASARLRTGLHGDTPSAVAEFQRPQRQPVGPDQQVAPEASSASPGAPSPPDRHAGAARCRARAPARTGDVRSGPRRHAPGPAHRAGCRPPGWTGPARPGSVPGCRTPAPPRRSGCGWAQIVLGPCTTMERPSTSAVPMAWCQPRPRPRRAGHQGDARCALGEIQVAAAIQHRPRESDGITRPPCPCARLQLGHDRDRTCGAAPRCARGPRAQLGLGQRFGGAQAAHVETQSAQRRHERRIGSATMPPGTALLIEQQARLRQRLPTGLDGHACLLERRSATPVARRCRKTRQRRDGLAPSAPAGGARKPTFARGPRACPAASPVGTRIA